MKIYKVLFLFIILFLFACQKETPKEIKGRVETHTIDSHSLTNNRLNEATNQKVLVYLPPNYDHSDHRYPVVYYLHGYGEFPGRIVNNERLDDIMKNNKEMIIVEANCFNKLGGCYYNNSEVTGNWEDFYVKEVIEFIDTNFRTIASRESRGISGYSMGGTGAINLALKHPELFASVLVYAPGLFDLQGLTNSIDDYSSYALSAYGAAYSPNLELEYPYANIPLFDGSDEDNQVIDEWNQGFGNLNEKMNAFKQKNIELNQIKIIYGSLDQLDWIPDGVLYFASLLEEENMNYEVVELNRNHKIPENFAETELIPFFSKHLTFE